MGSISIGSVLTLVTVVLYYGQNRHYIFSALFLFFHVLLKSFYSSQVRSCSVQNVSMMLTFLEAETIQPSNVFLEEVMRCQVLKEERKNRTDSYGQKLR